MVVPLAEDEVKVYLMVVVVTVVVSMDLVLVRIVVMSGAILVVPTLGT